MKRWRKFWQILKAGWEVLWSDDTVEATPLPRVPFDFLHDRYLYDLMKEQKFLDVLDGLCGSVREQALSHMRTLVRNQDSVGSTQAEATITAMEDLKPTLARYAAAYRGE